MKRKKMLSACALLYENTDSIDLLCLKTEKID